MTRDEAIKIAAQKFSTQYSYEYINVPTYLVDALAALGLLHLKTTEDKVRIAAAERLTGAFTLVVDGTVSAGRNAQLSRAGAIEIIDVLTKSGFRITKDE